MNRELSLPKIPDSVTNSARRAWLAGLGTVSLVGETTSRIVDQLGERGKKLESKGREQFEALVDRGARLQKESKKKVDRALDRAEGTFGEIQEEVDGRLTKVSQRLGIPHRSQIRALSNRVEELTRKIETLQGNPPVTPEGPRVFHLVPAADGWKLEAEGSDEVLGEYATKDKALVAGRELAQTQEPSRLVVHKQDGQIQTSYTYGE